MRVIFVLCEGAHDIAFLKHILKRLCGFQSYDGNLKSLPVPLAKMLTKRLSETTYDESKITALPKPIMPERIFQKEKDLYLLINSGGNTRTESVIQFIKDFKLAFDENAKRNMTEIKSYDLFFLTDADYTIETRRGLGKALGYLKEKYQPLAEAFINKLEHGVWHDTNDLPRRLGCFIFTNEKGHEGTLEDIILPMIRQCRESSIAGAEQYIKDHAQPEDKVSKSVSGRYKAALTIVGQLNLPGRPLSAIINDNEEWFPMQQLESNTCSRALASLFKQGPTTKISPT